MFNLLVSGAGWADRRDTMPTGRVLEYTDDAISARFMPNGQLDTAAVMALPTLFMAESFGEADPVARIGSITNIRLVDREVRLEYVYDPNLPLLRNSQLQRFAEQLDIADFEFHRTHWAVKEIDLFRVLLENLQPRRQLPRVFQIADPEFVDRGLVSAMMPFAREFDAVYVAIRAAAEAHGLHCRRADNIWENAAVMQDVVSLIDRSKIIVCDLTHQNPNVFYETGIAHALGREVILIAQHQRDIPFDLRHLRYLIYLDNDEGRRGLTERLHARFADLV
ncbi:MAG: hypothetical protein SF339_01685 [Blastocatellia bacterium]|nr:hypothetical protein [Blastocatellia bacterium]